LISDKFNDINEIKLTNFVRTKNKKPMIATYDDLLLKIKTLPLLLIVFLIKLIVGSYGCINTADRFERGYLETIQPPTDVYDQNKVQLITGRIFDLDPLLFEEEIDIINLSVAGKDGNQYYVHVAPSWFLKAKRISFKEGEIITIIGSVTDLSEEEKGEDEETKEKEEVEQDKDINSYVIVAREVRKKGRTLNVRTLGGKPLWYRQGKLRGRQLFIEKYIQEKNAGIIPKGQLPIEKGQNITPYSFPPFP
jgi:hypothetical protein